MSDSLWPLDCRAHGILQARKLEWVAFPFSRGSSQPTDRTQVSHIAGRFFTSWATREAQYYSLKTSVLQCSTFFMVQFSHLYMTTGKTIALTIWTFVSKMTSLLFNRLSRLVIGFLPRSKCLLISWLQSPSVVILETKKIKSVTVSIFFPSIGHEVMSSRLELA